MEVLKCKGCGAALTINNDNIFKCNFCGLIHTPEYKSNPNENFQSVSKADMKITLEERLKHARKLVKEKMYDFANREYNSLISDYPLLDIVWKERTQFQIIEILDKREKTKDISPYTLAKYSDIILKAKKYKCEKTAFANYIISLYNSFTGPYSYVWNECLNNPLYKDEIELIALWKTKVDKKFIKEKLKNDKATLLVRKEEYNQTSNKLKKERILDFVGIIVSLLLIFLPIINIGLLSISKLWLLGFLISFPFGICGFITLFSTNKKRNYLSKEEIRLKQALQNIQKEISDGKKKLKQLEIKRSSLEERVFQTLLN